MTIDYAARNLAWTRSGLGEDVEISDEDFQEFLTSAAPNFDESFCARDAIDGLRAFADNEASDEFVESADNVRAFADS